MRVATYLDVVIPIGNDILITGFFHFIKSSFGHMFRTISTGFSMSQSIHVLNIYLHLVNFLGTCNSR